MRAGKALALLAGSLLLAGCGAPPVVRQSEETRKVELGKAEMVRATIEMKAGELKIQGGAAQLLDGYFRYQGDVAKPEIRYDESSFRGKLTVRQGGATFTLGPGGETHHMWDLRMNNDVPLDLDVQLGAGQSTLDVRDMYLRGLDVHVGAGQVELNLAGKWRRSFDANIRGGVGQVNIRLPRDVAVEAVAQGGIGSVSAPGFRHSGNHYTYEPAGGSAVTIRLDVRGGIGEIRLRLAD
jgi:hypothetical protein